MHYNSDSGYCSFLIRGSNRTQFFTRLVLSGLLSGGAFLLQLGFSIFSMRSTLLEFISDKSKRDFVETPMQWVAVITTTYAIFFTFYMAVFFKLKPSVTEISAQDENQIVVNNIETIPKCYHYGVQFLLLTEFLNLFFSSYLISPEITSKKSDFLVYSLFSYMFLTNCLSYRAFTYDLAYKNAEYFYIRFFNNTLDRKKFLISALVTILTTLSQCIAVNFFSINAYKVFPLTQDFSSDTAKALAIGMSILYFPFGFLLGSVQTYRFFMGEEAYSGTLDSVPRCSKAQMIKALHFMLQGLYIICRSFITFASTMHLIKQLDPNHVSHELKIGCTIPIVMSYAAYEYFLICRSVNHFSHRFFSSSSVPCQFIPQDGDDDTHEMRLLA